MLNSYRRKNITELIRARNRLRTLTVLTGGAVFILVELGLITALADPKVGIDEKAIIMSTFYFLIGAGVGLFGRLYSETKVSKAVNDYHLTQARFELTPLLSGSAAVIAVIINQQMNLFGSNTTILGNLVIAILFGLVPNQLINQLQNKASEVTQNIQSVQPTEGKKAGVQTSGQGLEPT